MVTRGLKAYWPLDKNSRLKDITARGYELQNFGCEFIDDDIMGSCFHAKKDTAVTLNRLEDFTGALSLLHTCQEFHISFYLKLDPNYTPWPGNTGTLIMVSGVHINVNSNNKILTYIGGMSDGFYEFSTTTLIKNQWYKIELQLKIDKTLSLFINGEHVETSSTLPCTVSSYVDAGGYSYDPNPQNSVKGIYLLGLTNLTLNINRQVEGCIRDVKVFSCKRHESDIRGEYFEENSRVYDKYDTFAHYPLDGSLRNLSSRLNPARLGTGANNAEIEFLNNGVLGKCLKYKEAENGAGLGYGFQLFGASYLYKFKSGFGFSCWRRFNNKDCCSILRASYAWPKPETGGFWIDNRIDQSIRSMFFHLVYNNNSKVEFIQISNSEIELNVWTHYYVYFNFNTNNLYVYVNGKLDKITYVTDLKKIIPTDNPTVKTVGYSNPTGEICDVRFFGRDLSESEITEVYQTKVAHFKFNENQNIKYNLAKLTNVDACDNLIPVSSNLTATFPYTVSSVFESGSDNKKVGRIKILRDLLENDNWPNITSTPVFSNTDIILKFYRVSGVSGEYGNRTPLKPGTKYTITLRYKTKFYTTGSVGIWSHSFDSRQNRVEYSDIPITIRDTKGVWTIFKYTFTNRSDCFYRSFNLGGCRLNNKDLEYYVDWFRLVEGDDFSEEFIENDESAMYIQDSSVFNNTGVVERLAKIPKHTTDTVINKGAMEFFIPSNIKVEPFHQSVLKDTMTLSCWVKYKSLPNWSSPISYLDDVDNSNGFSIIYLDGVFALAYGNPGLIRDKSSFTVSTNTWYHVTVVMESKRRIKLYVNGEVAIDSTLSTDIIFLGEPKVYIGSELMHGDEYLDGYVADVSIYATALTQRDIKRLHDLRGEISDDSKVLVKATSYKNDFTLTDTYVYGNTRCRILKNSKKNSWLQKCTDTLQDDGLSYSKKLPFQIPPGSKFYIKLKHTLTTIAATSTPSIEIFLFDRVTSYKHVYRTEFSVSKLGIPRFRSTEHINNTDDNLVCFRVDVNGYGTTVLFEDFEISLSPFPNTVIDKFGQLHLPYKEIQPKHSTNLLDYSVLELDNITYSTINKEGPITGNNVIVMNNAFDEPDIVWSCEENSGNSAQSSGMGGFTIYPESTGQNDIFYRYSVWIRRDFSHGTNQNTLGKIFIGPRKSLTSGENPLNSSGVEITNPYFFTTDTSFNTLFESQRWYLFVGYMIPNTYGGDKSDYAPTIYSRHGVLLHSQYSNGILDGVMLTPTNANFPMALRTFLYYSGKSDEHVYWNRPRIDILDGTEPSIEDLLNGKEHSSFLQRTSQENMFPKDSEFLEIKEAHGVRWGKVFWHRFTDDMSLFSLTNPNEFLHINTNDKKSIMYMLDSCKINNEYEFLLEYSHLEGFNRWSQSSNPTKNTTVVNYKEINITWSTQTWGGLRKSTLTQTFVHGSHSPTLWYYSIGAVNRLHAGLPGPDTGKSVGSGDSVSLWVRIPDKVITKIDNTRTLICSRVDLDY